MIYYSNSNTNLQSKQPKKISLKIIDTIHKKSYDTKIISWITVGVIYHLKKIK